MLAGRLGRLQGSRRGHLTQKRSKSLSRAAQAQSLLHLAWDRAARVVTSERIVTLMTARQHLSLAQVAPSGAPGTVLVQPEYRGTAPGLLLSLLWIARRDAAATVAVLPADHLVREEDRLASHLGVAFVAARDIEPRVIAFGAEASGPDTVYGWIAPGDRYETGLGVDLYAVRQVWEQANRRTAVRLFGRGCFWNTRILVGGLRAYLELFEMFLPSVSESLEAIAEFLGAPAQGVAVSHAYRRIPRTNLSPAVLVQSPELLMVLAARGIAWSDWEHARRRARWAVAVGDRRRADRGRSGWSSWSRPSASSSQSPSARPWPKCVGRLMVAP